MFAAAPILQVLRFYFLSYSLLMFGSSKGAMMSTLEIWEDSKEGQVNLTDGLNHKLKSRDQKSNASANSGTKGNKVSKRRSSRAELSVQVEKESFYRVICFLLAFLSSPVRFVELFSGLLFSDEFPSCFREHWAFEGYVVAVFSLEAT